MKFFIFALILLAILAALYFYRGRVRTGSAVHSTSARKVADVHDTEVMLQRAGQTFQNQNSRGAPCKVTLIFQFNDGTSGTSVYLYGADSEGPPSDVVGFLTAAIRETESLYQKQLKMVSRGG